MIDIPKDFYNGPLTDKFKTLIEGVNILEEMLRYPNTESKQEANKVLARFMDLWVRNDIVKGS